MKPLDFSKEHLDNTMAEYDPLLCPACRVALRTAAEPIKDRLNEGKPPKMRHLKKLLRVLCPACTIAIARHKK